MPSVCPTGVTAIDTMVGAVTVTVVVCETVPKAAEILVVPAAKAVMSPAALTVAVAVEVEFQVTTDVRSALLPSL